MGNAGLQSLNLLTVKRDRDMSNFKLWLAKPIRCKLGLHKSDRDYGMNGLGGGVISYCECCNKRLHHPLMSWFGGGN